MVLSTLYLSSHLWRMKSCAASVKQSIETPALFMSLSLADNSCLTAKAAWFITGKLLELACSLVLTPLSTALSFFRRYCNLVQSWSHLFCVIREHFCSMSVQMEYLVNSQQVFRFLQCQKRDQSLHSEKSRASWGRKPLRHGRINDLGPSGLPTVVVRHHEKSERVVSRRLMSVLNELVPQIEEGALFRLNTLSPFNPKRCAPSIAHKELSAPS